MKGLAAASASAAVLCLVACMVYMGPGSRVSLDQRSARGMHEANHVSRAICCCLRGGGEVSVATISIAKVNGVAVGQFAHV
jgi:hypothetical protein